jgi:hypothetical protein
MKYCCKRLSIAKHSHGLYFKDMQSFACPMMGFITTIGILVILVFSLVTFYNIQNKNNNTVQIYHGRVDIRDFALHDFINGTRLIVQVNMSDAAVPPKRSF